MSKIGRFEFNDSCELHVVNGRGDSAPINDECEVDLEIKCILHCDDPEDGVYGEDIEATIAGTDIELGEEAIALLDLTNRAGEVFMDSGTVHPERGSKYMDTNGRIWTVVGTGMHHEEASDYTLLESRIPGFSMRRDPYRRMTVETNVLVHPAMVPEECEHTTEEDCTVAGCESKPMFRRVIEEDEPGEGVWRESYAVYVGKPASKAEKILNAPVSLEPASRGLGEVDGKTVADRAKEKLTVPLKDGPGGPTIGTAEIEPDGKAHITLDDSEGGRRVADLLSDPAGAFGLSSYAGRPLVSDDLHIEMRPAAEDDEA